MSAKSPRTHKRSKSNKQVKKKEKKDQSSSDSDSSKEDQDPNQINEDDLTRQSFADRLKILNLQSEPSSKNRKATTGHAGEEENQTNQDSSHLKKSLSNKNFIPIVPVGSLAQTLTQALNSTDSKLLETCFLNSNKDLISTTLKRLPKVLVHKLIEQLILCLNRRKRGAGDGATVPVVRRTKTLIEWVRQVLLIHMSYLLTIPNLVNQLSILHASLQKRLNLHTKLLSLNGRLELVLNQIELNKSQVDPSLPITKLNGVKPSKKKSKAAPRQEPYKYVEGESSSSSQEGQDDESSGTGTSTDEDEFIPVNSDEEGSVEDVVLGSGSDDDDSESSSDDQIIGTKRRGGRLGDLLDLEAEESGSGLEEEDDEDEDEDEDEDDDEDEDMAEFIDDGTEESEDDSDDDN